MLIRLVSLGLAAGLVLLPPLSLAAEGRAVRVAANFDRSTAPALHSSAALVINGLTGEPIYAKNGEVPMPIASITKVMTAMVVLDAHLPMNELITIVDADVDYLKNSGSRLVVGPTLPRSEMLLLALMSSENRAAAALARTYPGGMRHFVAKMNQKARALGMSSSVFYDSTGLNSNNSASAIDLARMVSGAYHYPQIRQYTTTQQQDVQVSPSRMLHYKNSNALVREGEWQIGLSKTGYIKEAGRCLVMQATVNNLPLIIVLLDGNGSQSRIQDAKSIRTWLERQPGSWMAG